MIRAPRRIIHDSAGLNTGEWPSAAADHFITPVERFFRPGVSGKRPSPSPPGRHELVARATDASGALQPATVQETWNVKGYGNNAWHRVAITAA